MIDENELIMNMLKEWQGTKVLENITPIEDLKLLYSIRMIELKVILIVPDKITSSHCNSANVTY